MNLDAMAKEAAELSERIRPFLAGKPPQLQGAVLADLLAIWLAGHRGPDGLIDQFREQVLAAHIEMVRRLVVVNSKAEGDLRDVAREIVQKYGVRVCLMTDAVCNRNCVDRCALVPNAKPGVWE